MAFPPFQVHQPTTVAEAAALAARHPGAVFLAGGTDLVVNLRKRLREPAHLISLRGVVEMAGITEEPAALVIGGAVTMSQLSSHEGVRARLAPLAEAAALVAGPTLRNMATLGGNLCLDTRCRYYNQSFFWRQANDFCLKKDGTVCHVAPGGSFCWAAFSADTAPVLMLLDAELTLASANGLRQVPLTAFYGADGRWPLGEDPQPAPQGLRPGELLVSVKVPLPPSDWRGAYEKLRVRDSIDFPLAGVALSLRRTQGTGSPVAELRLALTAVNPRPELVPGTEAFTGEAFTLGSLEQLKKLANRVAKPMRTTVADPAYRRAMVGALVERAAARLVPELAEPLAAKANWNTDRSGD